MLSPPVGKPGRARPLRGADGQRQDDDSVFGLVGSCCQSRTEGDLDPGSGRIAVIERLNDTPDVRRAIARGDLVDDLRELATEVGLVPLCDRALELASTGIIAFDKLPRFISLERPAPTRQG